jgi:hypothetical protein
MTTIESAATRIREPGVEFKVDEAQLAAVSFLARYSGRTLEAYRHDLHCLFQWPTDHGVAVMEASRPHIKLFRAWMENRGLAASMSDVASLSMLAPFAPPSPRMTDANWRARSGDTTGLCPHLWPGRAQDATGGPKHHRLSVICGSLGVADHSETPHAIVDVPRDQDETQLAIDEVWASR